MLNNQACLIAAPYSNSGKTLIVMSLLRHCANHSISVMPAKIGPDYIDPQFHALAARTHHAINLDSWAMRDCSLQMAQQLARDNFMLIEGAMGLYDGAGSGVIGSNADFAQKTDIPIILILPVKGIARSVCALVKGLLDYQPAHINQLNIIGVILNGIGSQNHQQILETALQEDFPDLPIIGAVPHCDEWVLPSRHLGLTQPDALHAFDSRLNDIASAIMKHIDFNLLMTLIKKHSKNNKLESKSHQKSFITLNNIKHIAIAYDDSCRFIYHAQLESWKQQNIQLSFFSILLNQTPSPQADMIFLTGGYPELFAAKIAKADKFFASLMQAKQSGAWIYGECGGYMLLGKKLIDEQGDVHQMAGLLDHSTDMRQPKRHLGYRICRLNQPTMFRHHAFTAHEFHYSSEHQAPTQQPLFCDVRDSQGKILPDAGGIKGRVMGSYLHLIDEKHDESVL
ncbi:MAG: cobyrinate a,c-diamide synthase [Alphaproteobacteria bacterium]|nr:cobyrinate a,c-diamide synthase [Alphaproteobacteria bacterium]